MTTAGIITIEIQGKDASLGDILDRMQAKATAFERAAQESMAGAGGAAEGARAGFLNLQATIARNEIAVGRAAVANKDYTTSAEAFASANARLNSILNDESASTTQVLSAQRQLVSVYSAATKAAEQEAAAIAKVNNANSGGGSLAAQLAQQTSGIERLTGAFGGLQSVLGSVGIAVGAKQILDMGINAGRASLELQQTENQLKQIAGSQDVYNKILQTAKQQQILFGGSLNDNLSELSSFAVAARTTGADLDGLIRTAQRLATLDPAQGIGGAKLALNEALSGNATSLNRRFEIPKAALDGLSDSSTTAAQKLAIVNKYLDDAGISANGAADAVTADAKAYNQLSAALGDIQTKIGGTLAKGFAPAAGALASSLNQGGKASDAASQSKTYDEYLAKLREIDAEQQKLYGNDVVGQWFGNVIGGYTQLTQTQFLYAQALQQQGVAQDQAIAQAQAYTSAASFLDQAIQLNSISNQGLAESLSALAPAYAAAAAGSEQSAAAAQDVIAARLAGTITDEQARAELVQLAAQYQANKGAVDPYVASLTQGTTETNNATTASGALDAAILKEISDKQASTQVTATLNAVQATLASLGPAVEAGLLTAGQGAAILASQYGIATQEGIKLLNIQAQLAHQQFQLKEAQVVAGAAVARTGVGLGDEVQRDRQSQRAAQTTAINERYAASEAARHRQIEATGSAAQKAAQAQSDYNAAVKRYGADSAQAIDAQTKILQLEDQAGKKGRGGKGAGAAKLSDQAKLNNSLASNEQRYNDQIEEAQITHGKNLQKIEQDYQEKVTDIQLKALQKRKQQADANEIGKRSSELGFLESATSSSLNGSKNGQADLGRIQADYYKAFDDAQKAAQAGDLEKSDRMLKAAEDRANTELKYAEKIADLKDKMGEAHNSKERAALQAQIGLQETLLTKARQIQDVKDQQNAAAPDAINATEQQDIQKALADRQQALTDETARNTDALDKLTRSLDNKNDLATGNALRAGKNVSATGAPAGASALDNSTPAPTTPAAPIPVAPVNTGSSAPLAINAPDVITAINQLQTGLDAIRGAVESAGNQVASKIQNQRFEVVTRSVS